MSLTKCTLSVYKHAYKTKTIYLFIYHLHKRKMSLRNVCLRSLCSVPIETYHFLQCVVICLASTLSFTLISIHLFCYAFYVSNSCNSWNKLYIFSSIFARKQIICFDILHIFCTMFQCTRWLINTFAIVANVCKWCTLCVNAYTLASNASDHLLVSTLYLLFDISLISLLWIIYVLWQSIYSFC